MTDGQMLQELFDLVVVLVVWALQMALEARIVEVEVVEGVGVRVGASKKLVVILVTVDSFNGRGT